MSKKAKTILTLIFCIIALTVALIFGSKYLAAGSKDDSGTNDVGTDSTPKGLIINEVVTSSQNSLRTEDGSAPDWIELYNNSSSTINLSGLTLSDDPNTPAKSPLPAVSLKSDEYLVVLCDGAESSDDGYAHANFRLSSKGDFIGIYSGGSEIHSLEIPALGKDIAYGRTSDGIYQYLGVTTPGAENSDFASETADFSALCGTLSPSGLAISEYQTDNYNTLMDQDGEHYAWVEIRNYSEEAVSLSEYTLSDNVENIGKWSFPDIALEPGACRIVFLSGKDNAETELHANFNLSSGDSCIVLSQKGRGILDLVPTNVSLPRDCSLGRTESDRNWEYFPSPTPGAENLTKSFSTLDKSEEKYLPDV